MKQMHAPAPVPPAIQLHHRLRIARESAGLDQSALAEAIGIARTTVSNAENGKRKSHRIILSAWAEVCQVPLDWLLGEDAAA